ncbi:MULTISPECIES: methyltransferase family protein [Methylomonas]|uniref:Protein-S-isoprenylcysteine methyltransferase n=2 Tax=Methylomonas TaxID=416 RepID=A0A126T4T8_9GAMM|nr:MULTISPECIES: isoprenylcysteine carboxylmethyltransferase family protein [Methylomonas]AMK77086.1 protein-S-isoprenylcysteine methyltransferase [Methylomonas denitrificans]OAH97167.1 protein-S-isoprenylcysteine methyltransferase [Methylomonas methanica]TCV82592.1 protein-S-isoprenylcysteine O-methyltransferase Ste14 [Methylomonas methanica]
MNALELRVPPVALSLFFAGAMWLASVQFPVMSFAMPWRLVISMALCGIGIVFAVAGVIAFRVARTTVNPTRPDAASTLVSSGIYRFSRNPMYVGFLFALGGWAFFLAHALGFIFLPAFVIYMNRFQISPEERALSSTFGKHFAAYTQSVPRWL